MRSLLEDITRLQALNDFKITVSRKNSGVLLQLFFKEMVGLEFTRHVKITDISSIVPATPCDETVNIPCPANSMWQ